MAAFPAYVTVKYNNPVDIILMYKTLKSSFDDMGKELRRRKWLYPKRQVKLIYKFLSKDDGRILWAFYNDVYGSYTSFYFFLEYVDTYENEYFGTGDGTTTTFTLPSKYTAAYTIYHNGTDYSDTDFTLNADAGSDGADQVVFNAAPVLGKKLTISFTGYLVIKCRFIDDNLTYTQLYNRFTNIGVTLKGLLLDE